MCAIAGIFSINGLRDLPVRIGRMCQSMGHRGPDAVGTSVFAGNAALGHCRLSIIDLQNLSNQPMCSSTGRYYLAFNGEIVNYREIRKMVPYPYRTNSDTEVILAAVQEKGLDWFLENAEGMYAFLLYDTVAKDIFLVRDRSGIKPLYYTVTPDGELIAASEIKGILSSGLVEAKWNPSAADDYLACRYVREPNTFFQGIYQVPHAAYLRFDAELKQETCFYYSLPAMDFSTRYDEREIASELTALLEQTTRKWITADVKVGSYLSGGVDSSLLTAILSGFIPDVHTYTIGFPDDDANEFPYAQLVADRYGTDHKAVCVEMKDYLSHWDELIAAKDAPLGVPNEILLSIMTAELSRDITVVLSGEGADELFGGYGRIFRSAFDFRNAGETQSFYDFFIRKYEYVPREFRDKYLSSDPDIRENRIRFDQKIREEFSGFSNEENIFRFFQNYHIQGLLQRLDSCTMRSSVEGRPPFLDHKLIDFVYSEIPYELKLKWNSAEAEASARQSRAEEYSEKADTPKYILKKSAEAFLPEQLVYRKKVGFPIPLNRYFVSLEDYGEKLLRESETFSAGPCTDLISDLKQLRLPAQSLWMLINIEKFRKMYFEKSWRY